MPGKNIWFRLEAPQACFKAVRIQDSWLTHSRGENSGNAPATGMSGPPRSKKPARYIYGSHRTRLRKSSGVQFSQAKSSPSIAAPIDREDGMSKTPGDSRVATKSRKWTLMVRRSAETSTRPSSAAIRKTSGSIAPSGIVPEAARKSIAGSLRSSPFRMSGSMSASA